jgi:hypothetical protein
MSFYHVRPLRQFDPAALLPRELPRNQRFETKADARTAWSTNRERIIGDQFFCQAISAIDECVAGAGCCDLPLCPRCGRRYRRWLSSRILLRIARSSRASMLTIYGGVFPRGTLSEADIRAFHGRIRKRIGRAGFSRTVLIGGTEVSWRADLYGWLLHMHLVVLDAPVGAINRLRKTCRSDVPGSPAIREDAIRHPATIATYVQKFLPIHHPGQRAGGRRPAAKPLPNSEAREFAHFLLRHEFQNFLFLFGCRRRGSRIEVL